MKIQLLLPLALALPVLSSCGDSVEASDVADNVKNAANSAYESIKDIDVSGLSMDAIKEKGGAALSSITESLGSIKDSADVEKLKAKMEPIIDKLGAMKTKLGASLPNAAELDAAIENIKSKFSGDSKVMESLQPFLDKLKNLVS